jgi:uncharacterized membrane protein YfcA
MGGSDILFLCVAGFLAGALNAVAGGGTIFTFSALLAIGVPPVVANATSASAVVVGSIASMLAYRAELGPILRRALPLCAVSVIGAAIGAALLLVAGDRVFGNLVPWLIFLATALFAAGPSLIRALGTSARRFDALALPLQGAVAIYGGYFGAGVGVMMLATLVLTFRGGYHEANAAKNLLAIVIQLASVVVFLALGLVDARFALAIAASSVLGGWIGVRASRAIPLPTIRGFVILTGVCLGGWTLLR